MATSAPLSQRSPEETNNPGQELAERELNPDRQTTPKGDPTDPRGNDAAAGNPSDPRGERGADDLQKKETAGDSDGSDQSFYRQSDSSLGRGRFSLNGRITKKRGLFGGGILALLASAIIGTSLLSGPAEMVQLSHILQNPFSKSDSDSHRRLGRLYRYAKSNQIGETRVTKLGSKIFGDTIDQLNEKGVTIKANRLTGRPTETTYETRKLENDFPELKGASTEARKAFLEEKLGVNVDQVIGAGTTFTVDQTEMNVRSANLLTKSTVGLLDRNGLVSAIKTRTLSKYFGLPSLFHPFSRALADKENQILNNIQKRQQEKQDEQDRQAKLTEGVEAKGEAAVTEVKTKGKFTKSFAGTLLITGGACLVYSTAKDIVIINHQLVVLPAEIHAVDLASIGAQAEKGQDLTMRQVQTAGEDLTDPATGKSIWQGQALKALETNGQADASLADIPSDYAQAFSADTTEASIQGNVDSLFQKTTLGFLGAGAICSPAGTFVQIVGGVSLAAFAAFGDVATGGAATPVEVGALAGVFAIKQAESVALSAIGLHFLNNFVLGKTTAKLAADAFSGPVGGDLLAYGARAAANTAAIASGGIALGNQASTILATQEQQQDEQQFRSLSLAQRLFSPYDYRSAVGKLIQTTSGSPLHNLARIGNIFTGFSSLFGHSLSAITPRAAAAGTPYNWGFPQYGLPDNLLNDPKLDNPYDNAKQVVGILEGSAGGDYKTRALHCFGVDINKDNSDEVWDVIPNHEINPSDASYPTNCSDTDENWKRIEMFVFDTTTMKAAACYQGDDQSCIDLGAISSGSSAAQSDAGSASEGTGSLPSGTAKQIAKQLIPYINNGKITCVGFGGNSGCSDITNTANGVSIERGEGCRVDALQPALLGMLLELVQMNHTFALSALCSDHHDDGLDGHAGGRAADFNTIDGVFMGPSDSSPWTSEKIQAAERLDQDIASFMPKGTGFGQIGSSSSQIDCHPNAPFTFLNGFSTFPDGCSHQHVQVGP
jgi:hypothetical protein